MNRRRHNRVEDSAGESSKRRKFVACQRCHAHKIKCSGELPCAKCRQVDCAEECHYASRDRQVKVSESYLDYLVSENRRLKGQSATATEEDHPERGPSRPPATGTDVPDEGNTSVRNPLIGDRAWFFRYDPSRPPIFIGEAACSAFATRFRRFLTGSNATAHIPRTQYVTEEGIAEANTATVQWPSLQQARLLVRIALRQVGHIYHLVLRKSTLEKLEEIYRTGNFDCTVNQCKFFALFAFGEAYSLRAEPSSRTRVPGTAYFARALNSVQVMPERTSITHLETLLLLSLFSYYLNRRHSALVLIGAALRQGLTIGLNHNIPESQLIDSVERQHRVRIWWTIYICDRTWGSKMGLPSQILDDDIHVDMPSRISPAQLHDEQFYDPEYLAANVRLARIIGEIIAKLYGRRKYSETFLQRVQKLLKALKNWVETLPEHLRLNQEDPEMNQKPITSLHLSFNQCVILTTRPTLLHLLIKLSESNTRGQESTTTTTNEEAHYTHGEGEKETISQPLLTLSEASIHAARHSHSLILTKWINGSLPVFGYFHAHYLFSASLVLAMSSLIAQPIGNPAADMGAFESGLEVLHSMADNGNLAAAEFWNNLEHVQICLAQYSRGRSSVDNEKERPGGGGGRADSVTGAHAAIGPGSSATLPPPPPSPLAAAAAAAPFPGYSESSPSLSTPRLRFMHPPAHPIPQSAMHGTGTGTGTAPGAAPFAAPPTPTASSESNTDPVPASAINAYYIPGTQSNSNNLYNPNPEQQHANTINAHSNPGTGGFTAAMAFLEPTMQDFLAQSDFDLGLLHPVDTFLNEAENMYTCHGL